MGVNVNETEITNPGSLMVAKVLSLIALVVVCLSGVHLIFEWTIFEAEKISLAFKAGLILMVIAMAFNGHAHSQTD